MSLEEGVGKQERAISFTFQMRRYIRRGVVALSHVDDATLEVSAMKDCRAGMCRLIAGALGFDLIGRGGDRGGDVSLVYCDMAR